MTTIKAIETTYKGYRFRSRLEARWAVFFEAMGIDWRYETEGFEVDGLRYLPDFYLPASETWVEVKGDPEGLRNEFARMSRILGNSSPLPGFVDSAYSQTFRGMLVLGDIPRLEGKTIFHSFLRHSGVNGLIRCWASFLKGGTNTPLVLVERDGVMANLLGLEIEYDVQKSADDPGWLVEARAIDTRVGDRISGPAYDAARRARFEHGEAAA